MAKKIFLVYGDPGHGKTTLACELKKHGYRSCPVDQVYVDFIKEKCPGIHFEKLSCYVRPHYDCIFKAGKGGSDPRAEHTSKILGTCVMNEWKKHLLEQVRKKLSGNDRVVVEGYPLKDCRNDIAKELRETDDAKVILVSVKNKAYLFENDPVTIDELISQMNGSHTP